MRPDDGYSLRLEIDGEMFVDRERVAKWLAEVRHFVAEDDNAAYFNDDPNDGNSLNEDDGFESGPVEMCDTRSAIAEGPWRRRIDKWNVIRGDRVRAA